MTTFETSVTALAGSDNAARRPSYQGAISLAGMAELKQAALARLPSDLARHHSDGRFHIHDLEALGLAPNCLAVDFRRCFPTQRLRSLSKTRRLLGIFDFLRQAIASIGADQSGGIGFANIDDDIAWACDQLSVTDSSETRDLLKAGIAGLIDWVNTTRTRYGLECYYVTFNIGLSLTPLGGYAAECLLDSLRNAPASHVRPNVVFKVRTSLHRAPTAPNRAILDSALATTALRMIPTYLLCDAEPNADILPDRLAIMGCRTRVAANVHGPTTAVGRGNLAYISVNLPRLAWEATSTCSVESQRPELFGRLWCRIAADGADAKVDPGVFGGHSGCLLAVSRASVTGNSIHQESVTCIYRSDETIEILLVGRSNAADSANTDPLHFSAGRSCRMLSVDAKTAVSLTRKARAVVK